MMLSHNLIDSFSLNHTVLRASYWAAISFLFETQVTISRFRTLRKIFDSYYTSKLYSVLYILYVFHVTLFTQDPKIGLIPRCMSHLFDRLNSQASDFSVRVSMLELYNEELFDLLSNNEQNTPKLRLFEDSARKVTGSRGIVSSFSWGT